MSTIKSANIADLNSNSVPVNTVVNGTAKAWVTFNQQGTQAIVGAFNVTSITDLGTGLTTINFTKPMSDAKYAVVSGSGYSRTIQTGQDILLPYNPTTTTISCATAITNNGAREDIAMCNITVFR